MNYVTTNIRIPESDYMLLKQEALNRRTSLAQVIRERITRDSSSDKNADAHKLFKKIRRSARKAGKQLKGFDIVEALREMRYNGKW